MSHPLTCLQSFRPDPLTEPPMLHAHAPGLQHCKQNSLCQCDTAGQWQIQPPADERDSLVYFKHLLQQSARLRRAASPPRSPPLLFCFFLRGHDGVGQTPRNTFKANARRTSTKGRYKDQLIVIACGLAEQCLSTTSPCLPRRATPLFISIVAPAASPSFVWP